MTTTTTHERKHPRQSPVSVEMDGPIWLKLRMDVPSQPPEDLLRWFTDPTRLAQWMGSAHVVELVPGGRYAISWERADRTMEGAIIVARPTELVFSWTFTHEPDVPARVVMVRTFTSEDGGGSAIVLVHGPYRSETAGTPSAASASESNERAGHLDGWLSFLPILGERLHEAAGPA